MSQREGMPIWYELITSKPQKARAFYEAVMGWSFESMPHSPMDYLIASSGREPVCGVMETPAQAQGMPDAWFIYIGVDDVDASSKKVTALCGCVEIEPNDIPGVGRFSFCADPQGAQFYLMRGESDEASTSFSVSKPGHCCWNELVTSDQKAALKFYSDLLGWEKSGAMPMGEMGDYTFINAGDETIGAVMDAPEKTAKPFWNFALQVKDIDGAVKAVTDGGGTIRMGPNKLPDDSGWLIQATDPAGAKIMFTGARK